MTATETLPPWAAEPMTEAELDARVEAMELADDAEDETHRPWAINSTGEAEWAMAHLAAIDTQLDAIHRQEVEWREQLETWLADAIRQPMARRFFFMGALVDYQRRRREVAPARPLVVDEDALVVWLRHSGRDELEDLIEVRERVRIRDLAKALEMAGDKVVDPATGETVPGVQVEPESVSVTVSPVVAS